MKFTRVHIHVGSGSTWQSRLLGIVLVVCFFAAFLLLTLGIWVVLAVAATVAMLVGLTQALFPHSPWRRRLSRRATPTAPEDVSAETPLLEVSKHRRSSGGDSSATR